MTHDAYYKLPKEWQDVVAAIMQAGVKLKDIDCHVGPVVASITVNQRYSCDDKPKEPSCEHGKVPWDSCIYCTAGW